MPYRNNYGWGDALAQIGQSLAQYGEARDRREIDKIKFKYGDNIEAWRQDALKNPNGTEGKWYKKYVGDPNQPLPEDPKVAQQRALIEARERLRNDPSLTPEQKRMLEISDIYGQETAGTYARLQPEASKPIDAAAEQKLTADIQTQYPNATALQVEELKRHYKTGQNPWMTVYTQGQVNPESRYSVFSPPVYDMKAVESTPASYMESMGKTKPQITQEAKAEELKLKKQKFEQAQKNFDERMAQTKKNYQLAAKSLQELVTYRSQTGNRADASAQRLQATAVAQRNSTLLSGYKSLLSAAERAKSDATTQEEIDAAQKNIDKYNEEILKIMAETTAMKEQLKTGVAPPAGNPNPQTAPPAAPVVNKDKTLGL